VQNHVLVLIVFVAEFYNAYAKRHGFNVLGALVWRFFATALQAMVAGAGFRLRLWLGFGFA
jgi:hypothetical protein